MTAETTDTQGALGTPADAADKGSTTGATETAKAGETAGAAKAGETESAAKGDAAVAAPASIKLPEGFKLEPGVIEALQKSLGPKAQEAVEQMAAVEQSRIKSEDAAIAAQDAKWAAELKADPELGGQHYEASIKLAARALHHFGGREAAVLLHTAGLANNPTMVRLFNKIGKSLGEDTLAGSAKPPAPAVSQEARLRSTYPSMFKE